MSAMHAAIRGGLLVGLLISTGCDDGGAAPQDQPGGAGTVAQAGQANAGAAGSMSTTPTAGAGGTGNSTGGSGNGTGGSIVNGGAPTGGNASMAGAGTTGGSAGNGAGGTPMGMNQVFSECRLHFGTIDSKAKEHPDMIKELDFFTPGWMGLQDTFDQKYVCDEAKEGAVLGKQVPVIVAYVSAFYVKRQHGNLCDCNVTTCGQTDGKTNDLCHFGSQYIKENLDKIVGVYENYAKGYAECYGTKRPIVFEMEPDWYQYIDSSQTMPMSRAESASIMAKYVAAMQKHLPNAFFSIDISPWVDDNGMTNGKAWYSGFDMSKFAFINTSGGSTLGADVKIRSDNKMTWAGVSQVTGRPILADTGYGANGVSAGHDANWDSASNLNARMDDGVVSISQYNPKADWGSTIASLRSQLKKPKFCP